MITLIITMLPFTVDRPDASTAYPNVAGFTDEQLTKTFYDDYLWRSSEGNPLKATRSTTNDTYLLAASNTTWPYPEAVNQSAYLRGMVTGTKTKLVGSASTYLYSVSFYDDKARAVQLQSTNITGDSINDYHAIQLYESIFIYNNERRKSRQQFANKHCFNTNQL